VFFVVVDYFLGRAILHYFNSGASAFVSLRYLRRRVISLLSVFGISLGVLVLIVVNSVMTGFTREFREQMRGSLSHVLVRFDSERVHDNLDWRAIEAAEWAGFTRRIAADPALNTQWQRVLREAVASPDEAGEAPPPAHGGAPIPLPEDEPGRPDPPAPAALSAEQQALLERLRAGNDLTREERARLRHQGRVTTPRDFYLAHAGNPDTEEGRRAIQDAEDRARRDWYTPLFREALQRQFEAADEVLRRRAGPDGQREVLGTSWRAVSKTFVAPKGQSRELPIAELIGVDPVREPEISRLGEYVASAELNAFRDQYVLNPLLGMLGALLGWETPASWDALEAQPMFTFTEDGANIGHLPEDMRRVLQSRGILTASGRVRWALFDRVEYHAFSPAPRLYRRLREAYNLASRTEDLERLGRILQACEADVRAELMRAFALPEDGPAWQRVNRTGARILVFDYLTGFNDSTRVLRRMYEEFVGYLRDYAQDGADTLSDLEKAVLHRAANTLTDVVLEAEPDVRSLEVSEAEREQALASAIAGIRDALERYTEEAGQLGLDCASFLRQLTAMAPAPQDVLPMKRRVRRRMPLPLSGAAQGYADNAGDVLARVAAYRETLPLRAFMQPGETADSYHERARREDPRPQTELPGIILGEALAEGALGMRIEVGDEIAVTIPRIYRDQGRLVPRTSEVWFRVTGFFRSGLFEENRGRMYCDFEELAAILADSETRYTLGVKLRDYTPYEGRQEGDRLKTDLHYALVREGVRFGHVAVWEDESRTLLDAVDTERRLISLIVSLIIALAGGVIVIVVYQLVNEKVRDIGILKSLGHSPWGIRGLFMFNALFIGLFGAVIGGVLGVTASEYLNQIEDLVDRVFNRRLFPQDVYFLTYIPSVKGADLVRLAVDVAAPVVLFSFFCGIFPALAAAAKDPVEALHHE
jgi:ABC-type lipoprotein release transport system permease subunit